MPAPDEIPFTPFGALSTDAMKNLVPLATAPMAATGAAAMGAVGASWAMWLGWTTAVMKSGQAMMAHVPDQSVRPVSSPALAPVPVVKKIVPKAKRASEAQTAPAKTPAATPAAPVPTADQAATPARAVITRPMALDAPKHGTADDLKLISGIGPKLEIVLNDLGIHHFDQIASWTKTEIDWVDDYLKFSGRIERDDWVSQARALASGGIKEYVRVFGKVPR